MFLEDHLKFHVTIVAKNRLYTNKGAELGTSQVKFDIFMRQSFLARQLGLG